MKFCVIMDEKGYLLGKEYEKPYRYSTYTAGGGDWWTNFFPKKYLTNNNEPDYGSDISIIAIFENEEVANKYINDYKESRSDFANVKVVNLLEL